MDRDFEILVPGGLAGQRARRKPGRGHDGLTGRFKNSSFRCGVCGNYVNAEAFVSGVQNRNHCPCCLWSKHVDLYTAGDRLAACKGRMQPVGLSLKKTRNKYSVDSGELMLIHQCAACGRLSINRIAADDLAEALFEVFSASLAMLPQLAARLAEEGIQALGAGDEQLVRARLFGWGEAGGGRLAEACESNWCELS
ncbi:MAG: RNHCP domain-containing protein [Anaerolineales bacterium]|nr:RNHCP domain-containing protein [Anaerolineales bacterium]